MCAVEVFKNNASGNLFLRHINSASASSLESFVKDHINKGTTKRTDGWSGYAGLKALGYDHQPIKLSKPEDASMDYHECIRYLRTYNRGLSVLIGLYLKSTYRIISMNFLRGLIQGIIR